MNPKQFRTHVEDMPLLGVQRFRTESRKLFLWERGEHRIDGPVLVFASGLEVYLFGHLEIQISERGNVWVTISTIEGCMAAGVGSGTREL